MRPPPIRTPPDPGHAELGADTRARTLLSARDTVDLCVPARRPISWSVSPSST